MPSKLRHLRFRFSLRSFLIFTALLACVLGWVACERAESRRQLKVAEQISGAGGVVVLAGLFDDASVAEGLNAEPQAWWRTQLSNLLGIRVAGVSLVRPSPAMLSLLSEFGDLEELRLREPPIRDLTPFATLSNLSALAVNEADITDLTPLAKLTKIERLDLGFTRVTDLAPLATLKNLRALCVAGTNVRDLRPLSGLQSLQSLNINLTAVHDLTPVGGLKNLTSIGPDGTPMRLLRQRAAQMNSGSRNR